MFPIKIFLETFRDYGRQGLLFPGYIEGNDLGNAWGVPTLFGLKVAAIYCGPHIVGSFPQ